MDDFRAIKPKDGIAVRDPDHGNRPLPEHGAVVAWNGWWQRRLNDGDVVETSEAEIQKAERAIERAAEKSAAAGNGGDK